MDKEPNHIEEDTLESADEEVEFSEDENEEPGELAGKVAKLKAELRACRKEKAEYLQGWQRSRADFINARAEEETRRNEIVKFAEERIIRDMLDLATTFERAFKGQDDANAYIQGFRHIYTQLMSVLGEHGIKPIPAIDSPLNLTLHEAVESIEVSTPEEDGVILDEVEKGYTLHGKVIKPGKVKVGIYKVK